MVPNSLWWTIALVTCACAAWCDYRTRTVGNRVWLAALLAMAPLLIIELAATPKHFTLRLLHAAGASIVLYLLWKAHVFEAGDAKGLMVIALALSPVGYYDPFQARISPVLDAAVLAFLLNHAWLRLRHQEAGPLMVSVLVALATTALAGGLVWWPIVVWA